MSGERQVGAVGRIFLGRGEHWALLGVLVLVLWALGRVHLHVRSFGPFALTLLAVTFVGLALVVWRHRPGEAITREAFDDAGLPHAGREEDEV